MQHVKFTCPAQKALPKPPLGPIIGQLQLPLDKVCANINSVTKDYIQNTPVRISLVKYSRSDFRIESKGPSLIDLVKKESFMLLDDDAINASDKNKHMKYVTCKQLYLMIVQVTSDTFKQKQIYKSMLNGLRANSIHIIYS